MDAIEQKNLHDKIDDLIRKSNGWDMIEKFFKENQEIQPFYVEARNEAWRDNCQSYPVILVMTIEKLLEKVSS